VQTKINKLELPAVGIFKHNNENIIRVLSL